MSEITLKPIGIVRSEVKDIPPLDSHDWGKVISEIVIEPGLADALDGIEEFSHVVVLYWMHKIAPGEVPHKTYPMGDKKLPLTGIFATRTPHRPNRIGKTTVRLLQRQGNILRVKGLDALDGSPVIDIKPYIPKSDLQDARVPDWIKNR